MNPMRADWPTDRIGISPFAAPLRVVHVVSAVADQQTAEALQQAHGAAGWTVDVRTAPASGEAGDLSAYDVVVLHGRRAGRLRRTLRGRVVTVMLVCGQRPGRLWSWLAEIRLARYTNAVVVSDDRAAAAWARLVVVPITRVSVRAGHPDPMELAAALVRACAWGSVQRQHSTTLG